MNKIKFLIGLIAMFVIIGSTNLLNADDCPPEDPDFPVICDLENDYEVISASDGFEAGLQVNHFKPDLLILDIMMPDIKGYEVCKKIKENPDTKDTKIIVLSAYLDEDKFKKMKEHGADACFSKPFPLPQLKEEVARLLGLKE